MADRAQQPAFTRRHLVNLAGRAGGIAAAYHTMAAMGLIAVPPANARAPELARNSGHGTRVVILGAGIAGMTAAYELRKAGYDCVILEARARAGGRNWTIRGGDRVDEIDSTQNVEWARGENLYFNAGPARLPHHHKTVLGYCKEFGIPLQVIVNDNSNGLLHDANVLGEKPVRLRQVRNDTRGAFAELMAKALDRGTLDAAVGSEDKEKVLAYLRAYGALQKDLTYRGSPRAGWATAPGAGTDHGKLKEPIALHTLVQNPLWAIVVDFGDQFEQSAAMLQPVGGMDRIAAGFAARLKPVIRFNAEVRQILRQGERGARVVYRDRTTGAAAAVDANFVLATIPLSVLKDIDADFSARHKAAIATGGAGYVSAAKVAFEAKRRFWEEDEQIYGGISWTTEDITQIWYPSTDFHGRSGILLGGYVWTSAVGDAFAKLAPAERVARALAQGEKLHPSYRIDVGKGVAVSWAKVPFNRGAWCEWEAEAKKNDYPVLLEPDGPFLFAGEHLSNLMGWQEGAMLSAHNAVAAIAVRAAASKT
jgi:monoamine oxidase